MFYVFDRIEGEFAVMVNDKKEAVSIPLLSLSPCKIGNVYSSDDGLNFIFDSEETEKRKKDAVSLHRSLFDKIRKNK